MLGRVLRAGQYRCPITGRHHSFDVILNEAQNAVPGISSSHVGHVKPRSKGGEHDPDNVYWTSGLGNRIQGNKSWYETVKTIIEMAEFQRQLQGISWASFLIVSLNSVTRFYTGR